MAKVKLRAVKAHGWKSANRGYRWRLRRDRIIKIRKTNLECAL